MSWNERYVELNTPWDLGAPSPVVSAAVPLAAPAPARVLVPGFGWGWDVEALADRGYEVVGVEIADAAVKGAAERIGPRDDVELVVGDLFDPPDAWLGSFDIVVEHTCYCAFDPERWPEYVDITARLLKPGGAVAGAFLHFEGGGPPFGTNPADLRAQFERRFAVERLETWPDPFPQLDQPQLLAVFRVQDPALRD
jgi:methyl halide transferase